MRIALVSTYPPSKGSLNEYAFHFVNHLRQKPEVSEVIILADELPDGQVYPADDESKNQATLRIRPCWRFGAWNNALRIQQACKAYRPDVVLMNLQFATFADKRIPGALGLLTPWLVKSTGPLTAILLHNIMETVDLNKAGFGGNPIIERVTRLAGNLFTRMMLKADLVAVTIPKYVDILTNKYHVNHVVLAPHGSFEDIPTPDYDLPDGPLQIMTFGKFGTYKKVEALIEAFEILQKTHEQPLELVIAGTDSPNTRGYLKDVQQQYAHVGNVRFTGYVAEEDVPRIFKEAAVVVFPYNSTTGSSGVLHQAGSYGKAVALPNLGDLAELVQEEGYTGEFFQPDEPESMAQSIARFLDDPRYRKQVAFRNYTAASGLPMSEVVDWYLLHFERLLRNRQSMPIAAT
ncbi:glycosyltransferase [Phototrophicus methaneseepsis]|uniref:Glycosyltransferase n=1 Tax=Phototrophicus methaneseepsis TaxID=2710758 RepID=A0A7S8EDG1_9CHLR|nr:glycosyltransferase [Phototrophicus methaneseepsis]QPC84955.1 glycosyltransferase [Phototrophicus methaneseepsis]